MCRKLSATLSLTVILSKTAKERDTINDERSCCFCVIAASGDALVTLKVHFPH